MGESDAERSFEEYVLPEVEVLLRVARSMTANHADAEDLVQDTMIRAYKAIDRFDGRHPRAWLLTILRNTNINRNRRRRPELLRDPDVQLELAARSPSDDEAVRPDRFVDDRFEAEIENALASLTPPFAEVIALVDIDGLSYAEAAQVLNVPLGTLTSRLHRARKQIRQRLRRSGVAPTFGDLEFGRAP